MNEEETSTITAANNDTNFFLQGELLESDEPTAQHISKLLLSRIREGDLVNDYLVESGSLEGIHSTTTPKQTLVMHQREFIKLLHLLCVTVPDLKVDPIVLPYTGVLVSKNLT